MKTIALAVLIATLTGCAVVPVGPPVYIGVHAHGGYGYGGGGYYGGRGYWR